MQSVRTEGKWIILIRRHRLVFHYRLQDGIFAVVNDTHLPWYLPFHCHFHISVGLLRDAFFIWSIKIFSGIEGPTRQCSPPRAYAAIETMI
ncbi:hypothetical protein HZ326_23330 [Fusarium oxysporum f. sp. albedinis]|nr:hypothetical protein HZ326_23330 [Fusarium oxysporum f. sp. albedinis]